VTDTDVEIYCLNADLAGDAADFESATPEERVRAARFHNDVDARHFLARRAATRRLLAPRLGVEPDAVVVARGPFGRPYLPASSIRVSVSHSGPLMLIAIADGRPLGCDIEQAIPRADLLAIADHCFTRAEFARLEALAPHEQVAAFYDCWTRKEAYLKAVGIGMSLPMNSFEFVDGGSGVARLANGGADWLSVSWAPAPGYCATVVAAGDGWKLDRRDACVFDQR
jgi:4'-phosphopantetheinyl transferase